MTAFDVFCLPSLYEGLPVALLEAMALGVPTVATGVGGVPELIKDGDTGLLVPVADPAKLAAALIRLLTDESFRKTIALAGYRCVQHGFSIRSLVDSYDRIYREVLG